MLSIENLTSLEVETPQAVKGRIADPATDVGTSSDPCSVQEVRYRLAAIIPLISNENAIASDAFFSTRQHLCIPKESRHPPPFLTFALLKIADLCRSVQSFRMCMNPNC
jgi:hypothetical protein